MSSWQPARTSSSKRLALCGGNVLPWSTIPSSAVSEWTLPGPIRGDGGRWSLHRSSPCTADGSREDQLAATTVRRNQRDPVVPLVPSSKIIRPQEVLLA